MFPEPVRDFAYDAFELGKQLTKATYNFTRKCGWVLYASGIVLIAPVMIESERVSMDRQLQRQVSLYCV